jgi:hypothetical protein
VSVTPILHTSRTGRSENSIHPTLILEGERLER